LRWPPPCWPLPWRFSWRSPRVFETLILAAIAELLLCAAPEGDALVDEDLFYEGALLLHPLRYAVSAFHAGRLGEVDRLLACVDLALTCGDGLVQNAVCVSFVEHVGFDPLETTEFVARWPAVLLAERERQPIREAE
jgi:hypothetical protein